MADYCGNFLGALASLCFAVTGATSSDAEVQTKALDAPQGRVVLTIDGNIAARNAQARADFDLAMLEALPARQIATSTPWTDGVRRFDGVPLKEVLEATGANGEKLTATSINGYTVTMPVDEAVKNNAVLAYRIDGAAIPVDDKGPLWILFPFDEKPGLANPDTFALSAWQLRRLTVAE